MSAHYSGYELRTTRRYELGELLRERTRHLLLMTATPHAGRHEDFHAFLALLDPDRFEGNFAAADGGAAVEFIHGGLPRARRLAAQRRFTSDPRARVRQAFADRPLRDLLLDVLTVVEQALRAELGGVVTVVGPLDGGTPATARQRLVDEFSFVAGPAVLVSQIAAGGTGLNMQAAPAVPAVPVGATGPWHGRLG